ncbi:ABC transporter, nucleotide binding/ATPase protein [Pseudomonas amygdali pv. tabaci]|uniref:ABC transporter, nucleotide binding/ATPase protein n=2 Tax=Pseudomonas syringae group genomosp. 2 TaxID=251698 RepID=A0A3M6HR32_PSEAJ|nr:ABC transporter, nucleotide binding/ATPase protein [Pseudomonas amygdali pv. tabaci]
MVMYDGANLAERRIADTDLNEVVELIVGHKFTARSACA